MGRTLTGRCTRQELEWTPAASYRSQDGSSLAGTGPPQNRHRLSLLSHSGPLYFAPSFSSDPKAYCVCLKNKERC
ncbi:hypothetical protein ZWY2020_021517 [Hordeum vulgare]|nr:hypothetical protein ZWY2020_021517 [Hordeum vulgare]